MLTGKYKNYVARGVDKLQLSRLYQEKPRQSRLNTRLNF